MGYYNGKKVASVVRTIPAREKGKNFIFTTNMLYKIHFENNCRVLITENIRKKSKQILARYIDKKQGNRITNISINAGNYDIGELIETIFGATTQTSAIQRVNSIIHQQSRLERWSINATKNYGKTFYEIDKSALELNPIKSSKIKNYFSKTQKNVGIIKLQFKFVKDFEMVEHSSANYWKGTMANAYLECIVFMFKNLASAFITAQIKRF